jgi:hypothetical protein
VALSLRARPTQVNEIRELYYLPVRVSEIGGYIALATAALAIALFVGWAVWVLISVAKGRF